MNNQILLESFELPVENQQHVDALRYIIENEVNMDIMFEGVKALEKLHKKYNELVLELDIDESCLVKPNDTAATIRKKCKKAFGHGLKMEPMRQIYAVDNSPISARLPSVSGGAMSEAQLSYSYGVSAFDGMYKKRTPPEEKETLSRKWSEEDPDSALSKENVNKLPNDIQKFTEYACKRMGIKNIPKIGIVEPSDEMSALGAFDPQTNRIMLVTNGRLMADILRTLAHELVHVKQNELGKIKDPVRDGGDGSPIENQANAAAGVLMRQFGRENKNIYLSENINFQRTSFYEKYYKNLSPSDFGVSVKNNKIEISIPNNTLNEGLLVEGGAAGHMTHPFEDKDLTFGDMKTMIDRALIGSLDVEEPATEKLDGQNIAFTVREDGEIVFARNKGHVKNRGKNALDVAGIRQKFAGRGGIEKAFTGAAEDLAAAVEKLTPDQRQELFKGGSSFMNIEVILPDSQNVIPYGRSVLTMHGTIQYDEDGNEVSRDNDAGRSFAKAVRQVGADRQKTFGIEGPRTIAFDESVDEELEAKADEYKATIDRAAATFDLGDDAKLEDYRRAWWEREIEQMDSNQNIGLSPQQKEKLVSRWADGDKKAIGVKDLETPEQKEWFRTFEADQLQNAQKKMIRPIEYSFLKTGAQALKRVTGWMAANNPEAAAQIRKDTLEAIKGIKDSDDPDLIAKMQQQFDKLEAMGLDNVVPSEGIVFTYNGNLYKFTGTFAPINQITGTFKFGMPPKTEEKPEEPKKEPVEEPKAEKPEEPTPEPTEEPAEEPTTPKREVAIFAGRFHPFHKGHHSVYQNLVDRFGKDNVYIASSDVQKDPAKQPFSFNQKKDIITQMFDVPEDMVVQVKNPYAPKEILDKLPDDTTYVTAVSQKDADRLAGSKYFKNIDDVPPEERTGYKEGGYFAVTPEFQLDINGKNISGTALRHVMGSPKYTDRAKEEIFTKVYGRFDQDIFDMITNVTGKAEAELEKTQQYVGEPEEKPVEPSPEPEKQPAGVQPIKPTGQIQPAGEEDGEKQAKAKLSQQQKIAAQSILQQKITNPKTGKQIYVASALKYDDEQPVKQLARQMLSKAVGKKIQEVLFVMEAEEKSTERVRKYYKRNPGKVKAYLRKTVDDRVKRNKDRREAVKKHGKSKMKNHDVHHPNGVNGKWELAKKDHGRDKKDDKKKKTISKPTKKTTQKRQPKKLGVYLYTRDHTDTQLRDIAAEYFDNEKTFKAFPNLAKDERELRQKILQAPTKTLTKDELTSLQNSEVPEILSSDNSAEILRKIEVEYKKDVRGILKAIKGEEEISLPVVIKHPTGMYLLAGNTRLSVLASLGHTMPVKILNYVEQPATQLPTPQLSTKDVGNDKQDYKSKLKDVLNMKITNPETGNRIKIDTAMNYKKEHPAHQIALGIIRQQLGSISPTAGIPKQRRYS